MFSKLFIFWLVILPFVVWKNGYEGAKVIYFFFGAACLSVYWIKKILSDLEGFELSKTDKVYFLWLLILLIASLLGIHPLESVVGGSYRHQGLIFFVGLWLVGKTISILSVSEKKLLIKAVATSVLVETVVTVLQFVGGNLYFGKAFGTLGEANAVAGFLSIGSYFVFETFPYFTLLFPVAAIMLLQSRSAVLSLLPHFCRLKKRGWLLSGVVVVVVVVAIALSKNVSVFENRPLIWKLGINQVLQRPLLGFGAESGEAVYNLAYKGAGIPLLGLIVDRAHNLFLDIALWSGVLGLVTFCAWLYYSFLDLRELNRRLAFVAFLVYASLQPLSIAHWILLTVILLR